MPYVGRPVTFEDPTIDPAKLKTFLAAELKPSEPNHIMGPKDWTVPIMSRVKTKHAVLGSKPAYDALFNEHGSADGTRKITQLLLDIFEQKHGNPKMEAEIIGLAQLGNSRPATANKPASKRSTLVALLDVNTSAAIKEQQMHFFELVHGYSDATMLKPDIAGKVAIASFGHNRLSPLESFSKVRAALLGKLVLVGPVKIF